LIKKKELHDHQGKEKKKGGTKLSCEHGAEDGLERGRLGFLAALESFRVGQEEKGIILKGEGRIRFHRREKRGYGKKEESEWLAREKSFSAV